MQVWTETPSQRQRNEHDGSDQQHHRRDIGAPAAHPGEIVRDECLKPLGLTMTRFVALSALSRNAGEGRPSRQRWWARVWN